MSNKLILSILIISILTYDANFNFGIIGSLHADVKNNLSTNFGECPPPAPEVIGNDVIASSTESALVTRNTISWQELGDFRVKTSRPRIYIDQPYIDHIRTIIFDEKFNTLPRYHVWRAMKEFSDDYRTANSPSSAALSLTNGSKSYHAGIFSSLITLIEDNETNSKRSAWSVSWLIELSKLEPPPRNDDNRMRGRLQAMAQAYDWLHAFMTEEQKQTVRTGIISHLRILATYGYMQYPSVLDGHERWGVLAMSEAVLAIYDDIKIENKEFIDSLLIRSRSYVHEFASAQSWLGEFGGTQMGWAYGKSGKDFDLFHIWTTATNEDAVGEWLSTSYLWYLYGMRSDGTYFNVGNAYSNEAQLGFDATIFAIGAFNDPVANWFLFNRINNPKYNGDKIIIPDVNYKGKEWAYFKLLLYLDENIGMKSPEHLPLARNFQPAGGAIMRTGWFDDPVVMFISSNQFYTFNHNHQDQASITLHYKKPLITEAGVYDKYGSRHFSNFYTRSIAHNVVRAYDSGQIYKYMDKPFNYIANDGGQESRAATHKLDEISPGGVASLKGITKFDQGNDYVYLKIDATDTYNNDYVSNIERQVIFLNENNAIHPVIIVYDEAAVNNKQIAVNNFYLAGDIVSAKSASGLVNGNNYTEVVNNNSGVKLVTYNYSRYDVDIDLVSKNNIYKLDGDDYPPELSPNKRYSNPVDKITRLEVANKLKSNSSEFISVFAPMNDNQQNIENVLFDYDNDGLNYIISINNQLVFIHNTDSFENLSYTNQDNYDINKILFANIKPRTNYVVYRNSIKYYEGKSSKYGIIQFELSLSKGDKIVLSEM